MIAGLLCLLFGGALLASAIFSITATEIISLYWPLALIVYALYRLSTPASRRVSLGLLLLGLFFQAERFGLLGRQSGTILTALVLIFIGLHFIFCRPSKESGARTDEGSTHRADAGQRVIGNQDLLDEHFTFTSQRCVIHSDTFSGGEVQVNFSNVYLDLRNVWPLEPETHLKVSVRFGNLELDIPSDWHCIINGKHYYGSCEAMADDQTPLHTLIITDTVQFGSFRVL